MTLTSSADPQSYIHTLKKFIFDLPLSISILEDKPGISTLKIKTSSLQPSGTGSKPSSNPFVEAMQKNEEQIGALYAKTMNQTPSPRKRREDYETTADLASGNVPWASDSPEDIAIFSDASSPTQINSYLKGSVAEINELFGKKAMAACAVVHAEADARDGEGPEEGGNDGLFLDSGMNNVAASSIVKQPKKTYRLPFQSFFINLLKTDNHEAVKTLVSLAVWHVRLGVSRAGKCQPAQQS